MHVHVKTPGSPAFFLAAGPNVLAINTCFHLRTQLREREQSGTSTQDVLSAEPGSRSPDDGPHRAHATCPGTMLTRPQRGRGHLFPRVPFPGTGPQGEQRACSPTCWTRSWRGGRSVSLRRTLGGWRATWALLRAGDGAPGQSRSSGSRPGPQPDD